MTDYLAYDSASTRTNWRAPHGYGDLIVASLPFPTVVRLSTPVEGIELEPQGVAIKTPRGGIHAKTAILTVSTAVLAAGAIKLPHATRRLAGGGRLPAPRPQREALSRSGR